MERTAYSIHADLKTYYEHEEGACSNLTQGDQLTWCQAGSLMEGGLSTSSSTGFHNTGNISVEHASDVENAGQLGLGTLTSR
jgi:hypothetical protein